MSNIGHIRYYLHAALTTDQWQFDYLIPAYILNTNGDVTLSVELNDDKVSAFLLDEEGTVIHDEAIQTVDALVKLVRYYDDKGYEKLTSIPDAVTQAVTRLADETQQAISSQDLLRLSQVKIKHKEVVEMVLNCECDALTIEAKVSELGEAIETAISSALEAAKKSQVVDKTVQAAPPKVSKKPVEVETKPVTPVVSKEHEPLNAPPIGQRKHVKVFLVSDLAAEFEVEVQGRLFEADSLDALKSLLTRKLGKQDATELYQEVYDALYDDAPQPAQDDQEAASNILDCTLPIEDRVTALRRHYDLVKLGICETEDEYDTMLSIAEALCDLEGEIDMNEPLETYISFDDQD